MHILINDEQKTLLNVIGGRQAIKKPRKIRKVVSEEEPSNTS